MERPRTSDVRHLFSFAKTRRGLLKGESAVLSGDCAIFGSFQRNASANHSAGSGLRFH